MQISKGYSMRRCINKKIALGFKISIWVCYPLPMSIFSQTINRIPFPFIIRKYRAIMPDGHSAERTLSLLSDARIYC